MAQIFSPAADTWLRLFLLGGLAIVAGGTAGIVGFARSAYITSTDFRPSQPVPFSHRHHAGELGIDCRYCHSSVETAPRAGLPPTETCMTCHSQIWTNASMLEPVRKSLADDKPIQWTRVAKLPDYVFFRHDVHIAKGVGCETCHGRIDQMALTYPRQILHDGVLPRLPQRSRAEPAAQGSHYGYGLEAASRRAGDRRGDRRA